MSNLEQSGVDAETLDRVDIVYKVTTEHFVTAGVYSGITDKRVLAEHIMSNGVDEDHIMDVTIVEARIDDKVVAHA